jgi:hypothetical protein
MKIIFLDIDGVLNHQLWFKIQKNKKVIDTDLEYNRSMIDETRVDLLNDLIKETKAKVVISSSWRKNHTKEELQIMLEDKGFVGEIIGLTPCLRFTGFEGYVYSVPRGNEIKAWLETNKGILNNKMSKVPYVIFDDDSDMLLWQRENFFWVDPYCGLTPNIIYKAKRFLGVEK